jgi:hypothetical protein
MSSVKAHIETDDRTSKERAMEMLLICEHDKGTLERTCHICEAAAGSSDPVQERIPVGIDENELAWLYIAPGYENEMVSKELLAFARDLIGPNAWAVLQISEAAGQILCEELGLRIVASYVNQTDTRTGISVHLVKTGELL